MEPQDKLQLQFRDPEPDAEVYSATRWRGVSAQFSRLRLPAEYEFTWDGHTHYLAHHDLVLIDGEMQVLGEKPAIGRDLRDQMTYVPAGYRIEGWAKPANRLNAFTVVCFDPSAMEEEFQVEFNRPDDRPRIYFKDDTLGSTMRKLGRLLADDGRPTAKIYAETLGLTAALEMFRIGQAETTPSRASGRLTEYQSKMAQDYIAENLSRDIGLDDLASTCGLTRFHFSRAFKATFGMPPYRYLTQARIEQAKQMLAETQLPISNIATVCGFSGATQFGRSFRDLIGQTPLEFRRRA